MASEFFLTRTNRLPVLRAELADSQGVINLSGASVEWKYRIKPTGVEIVRNANIISGDLGIVQYSWISGDVNEANVYWGQWRVTFSDGRQECFPNDSYLTFEIIKDLGD